MFGLKIHSAKSNTFLCLFWKYNYSAVLCLLHIYPLVWTEDTPGFIYQFRRELAASLVTNSPASVFTYSIGVLQYTHDYGFELFFLSSRHIKVLNELILFRDFLLFLPSLSK